MPANPLAIRDLRGTLANVPANRVGTDLAAAEPVKTSATLHYNGPAVDGAGEPQMELRQLAIDAHYHVDKVWGYDDQGRPLYGDGIMYHFAILSDGTICQLRTRDRPLWHCANAEGNHHSLAVHLPLGEGQHPTPIQWQRTCALFDALGADYGFARAAVRGHTEWPKYDAQGHQVPNSPCPGTILLPMLRAWRAGQPAVTPSVLHPATYRVIAPAGARVRQGPSATKYAVAATLPYGALFFSDKILPSEDGDGKTFAHYHGPNALTVADVGFVETDLVEVAA